MRSLRDLGKTACIYERELHCSSSLVLTGRNLPSFLSVASPQPQTSHICKARIFRS